MKLYKMTLNFTGKYRTWLVVSSSMDKAEAALNRILGPGGWSHALVTAMAMHAENQHRLNCGMTVAYGEDAFLEVIDREGISHNAVLSRWRR